MEQLPEVLGGFQDRDGPGAAPEELRRAEGSERGSAPGQGQAVSANLIADGACRADESRPPIGLERRRPSAAEKIRGAHRAELADVLKADRASRLFSSILGPNGTPVGPLKIIGAKVVSPLQRKNLRSEEHTSELQSLRHLVCR